MKTRIIAGHEITLPKNTLYIATRPIAKKGKKFYDVTIRPLMPGDEENPTIIIRNLTYDEANKLINEFNNGEISFLGRKW